jgi:acyl-coenzyme A thioesterase PaaI-like protein
MIEAATTHMIPGRIGVKMGPNDADPSGILVPYPEICFRGAPRAAAYVMVVDCIGGWVADRASDQDWVTTTDLSVRMPVPLTPDEILTTATPLRSGRRIISAQVAMTNGLGEPIAHGYTSFARVPRRDGDGTRIRIGDIEGITCEPLTEPLAEAAGITVLDAMTGRTTTELTSALTNPMNALQGAMAALLAEVSAIAVLDSNRGAEHVVTGIDLRYLSMGNVGPITTVATIIGDPSAGQVRVELRDKGHDDRIIAVVLASLVVAG